MASDVARLSAALADRYRIERELGAGGMATVYLAHDLRHDRKVALKVLRPELAAAIGAERFLSEIRTTANLQHPHILPLFDSGEADEFLFFVMPYVEGETVHDRLNREKQLPVADATRITSEVASALDYAHRHGVIHRDIKPENILLHDGQALVADFGIALAVSTAGSSRMTETGISLGTPLYMSPEQAMGQREITARSDVYALGAVLYEMLTGDPPFTGSTAQAIVTRAAMESPRAMVPQRHTIPAHVEAAVMKALEKLPADRFATAAEFADALARPELMTATTSTHTAAQPGPAGRRPLVIGLAAALVVATGVAVWGWVGRRGAPEPPMAWQYVSLGDSVRIDPDVTSQQMALSPDGEQFAFVNPQANGSLWLKRTDRLDAVPIAGTEGASDPTFSPDGQWLAYVDGSKLLEVNIASGTRMTVADSATAPFGGVAWLDDGTLVYVGTSNFTLRRVAAVGGGPSTRIYTQEGNAGAAGGISYPVGLPGGRGVLFQFCGAACVTQQVRVLDLKTGRARPLIASALVAWYMPNGFLMYVTPGGKLLAAPFDLGSLSITGPAVPVVDGLRTQASIGLVQVAWSRSGSLVYFAGVPDLSRSSIVRVQRNGQFQAVDTAWTGAFNSLAISPDGRRLAVGLGGSAGFEIWVKQLDHGPLTRLTFSEQDRRPAWSPDGRRIAFIDDSGTTGGVFVRAADGTGPERLAARLDRRVQEVAWSSDGKWLLMRTDRATPGAGDIVGVRTDGDTTPVPLVASPFTEVAPAVSPDGRWIAYHSNESGQNEVYVRPFPHTDQGRWQVSVHGGTEPVWSRDGRSLFYRRADGWLVEAVLKGGATFAVAAHRPLFDASGFLDPGFHQSYDVAPDGKSFLFIRQGAGAAGSGRSLVRIDRWRAALNGSVTR